MNLLGISGLAGAGKDTAADILVRKHGFVKISLADPMKRICREVFCFSDEQLWGPSAKRNAPDHRYPRICDQSLDNPEGVPGFLTPRHALQQLGTEWGRDCYENVWVDYAIRIAHELLCDPDPPNEPCSEPIYNAKEGLRWRNGWNGRPKGVVVPDVRFRNELDAIREAGGRVLRIVRSSAGLTGEAARHASEAEQVEIPNSSFDGIIYNDASLEDLEGLLGAYLRARVGASA